MFNKPHNNILQYFSLLFFVCTSCTLLAQNGLPDNMDTVYCYGAPQVQSWNIRCDWSSDDIVSTNSNVLVGDLDGDGHPELVAYGFSFMLNLHPVSLHKTLLVFDGVTHSLKCLISMPAYADGYQASPITLVRLSNGVGLIVVAHYDRYLRAYNISANNPSSPYWVSDLPISTDSNEWANTLFATDIDHDGTVEILARNKIFSAENGHLLATATGGTNQGCSYCHYTHAYGNHVKLATPVAADMAGNNNLEVILGNEIYSVSLTNHSGSSGNTMTKVLSCTPPHNVIADGNAQVADFNNDGFLDVFISNRDGYGDFANVNFYVWDVHNNSVSHATSLTTAFSGKNIPLIADINNDNLLEVIIHSGVGITNENRLRAFSYHYSTRSFLPLWQITTDEDSFSNTPTVFDFNQDGLVELLLCDQSTVRIMNPTGHSHLTGNDTVPIYTLSTYFHMQVTIMHIPVVADVDNDGQAEFITLGKNTDYDVYSPVCLNIFKADSGSIWAPARHVWNQYLYNVTNVNDNLTIPRFQFNNAHIFTEPDGTSHRPFNNCLQQATYLNHYGVPYTPGKPVHTEITVYACHDYTWPLNGQTYFAPGTYYDTIISSYACDTMVTLHLEITNLIPVQTEMVCCDNYTWPVNGHNYLLSGQYTDTTHTGSGCDTLTTLNLTIQHNVYDTLTAESCGYFTWPQNGLTYINSGYYYDTVPFASVCDSFMTLNLNVTPMPFAIIDVNPTSLNVTQLNFTASDIGNNNLSRQWYIDEWNTGIWTLISTDQSFTYTASIDQDSIPLMLAVSNGDCVDTDYYLIRFNKDGRLWIPNTFTPGRSTNNRFRASGIGIKSFVIDIFDRRGFMVYHSSSIQDGWDGTYRGQPVPQAAYTYIIRYRTYDNYDTIHKAVGTVLLIRN